jgi:hypothetical protein
MAVVKELILKKNDLQPYYYAQVKDSDNTVVDLTNCTAVFTMKNIDSDAIKVNRQSVNITDATNGKFEYRWSGTDTDTVGIYYVEFEVTSASGKFTLPADGKAIVTIKDSLDTT